VKQELHHRRDTERRERNWINPATINIPINSHRLCRVHAEIGPIGEVDQDDQKDVEVLVLDEDYHNHVDDLGAVEDQHDLAP